MQKSKEDGRICSKIFFTDEATISLFGSVKKQNTRYWSTENPHCMKEQHTQWYYYLF